MDAEHWVHVWGRAATAVLGTVTVVATLAGLGAGLLGAVIGAVFWGSLTAVAGWLTSAWRDERPWAWWVWTSGTVTVVLTGLSAVVDGSWFAVPWVLVSGVLLLLLVHPDSRARIGVPEPQGTEPSRVASPECGGGSTTDPARPF
ncbi:hypothetical protein [Blastococcus brunescens]|uniref:Integral membrane protein n=1 Tax=Blastococcus brunescens TaxID=1564165 RepID=A0ABZ1AY06_9ACTN|nr:hypothetical protein [Blastococcus sp. BMG 8361]WRL63344.1 hypothetical protein U6N30_26930 [Blastococcus sp. BMG 8361]